MLLEIRSAIQLSHIFPIYVMIITSFLASITGLLVSFRKKKPEYFRWLAIYCFLSLAQTILCFIHYAETRAGRQFLPLHAISANIFMIAEFFIVFRYLHQSLFHSLARKIIGWVQILFTLLCIIYWLFINSFLHFAHPLYVVEALSIFPFCLYYYYEIFTLSYLLNLGQESPFWINIVMAFHFLCLIPLSMFSSFPEFSGLPAIRYVVIVFYSACAILYGVLIKGFLCNNPEKKVCKIEEFIL